MAEQRPQQTPQHSDRIDALRAVIKVLNDVDWAFNADDLITLAEYVRIGRIPAK
jgi:hypothetical protein